MQAFFPAPPLFMTLGIFSLQVVEINDKDGSVKFTCLGSDLADDQKPQYTVPPNVWFGSFPTKDFDISPDGSMQRTPARDSESHYSLVGCTCAPAFQFQDFELAKRSDLLSQFPHLESLINALTYPDSWAELLSLRMYCHLELFIKLVMLVVDCFYSGVDCFCSVIMWYVKYE